MFYLTIFTGVCSLDRGDRVRAALRPHRRRLVDRGAQIVQNLLQLGFAKRKLGIWTQAELSLRPFIALVRRTA